MDNPMQILGLLLLSIILLVLFIHLFKKELKRGIKLPIYEKPRYACPFYGFHSAHGAFTDQDGNQCPLIVDSLGPCKMEMAGLIPNWEKCTAFNIPDNQPKIREIILNNRIFPREFHPEDQTTWSGIGFPYWKFLGLW